MSRNHMLSDLIYPIIYERRDETPRPASSSSGGEPLYLEGTANSFVWHHLFFSDPLVRLVTRSLGFHPSLFHMILIYINH